MARRPYPPLVAPSCRYTDAHTIRGLNLGKSQSTRHARFLRTDVPAAITALFSVNLLVFVHRDNLGLLFEVACSPIAVINVDRQR